MLLALSPPYCQRRKGGALPLNRIFAKVISNESARSERINGWQEGNEDSQWQHITASLLQSDLLS